MKTLILQNLPWFWFAMAVIFTLLEVATMGLTTIWFAIGSFIMIFLSFTGIPFLYQIFICLIISSVLLFFTRPIAVKKLKIGSEKTNTDLLIGKDVLVLKKITPLEKGEVKLGGVIWSAKLQNDEEIEENSVCTVKAIEGASLVVAKKQ